jgi:hypothetical protein
VKPRTLLKTLVKLESADPLGLFDDPVPLYRHIVSVGAMRTIAELIALVRRLGLPLEPLRAEIRDGFYHVLRAYAWSTTNGAVRVANRIRGIGLSDHGRVLNVMQPADAESIIALISQRNPHYAARYVTSLARSNPALFHNIAAEIVRSPVFQSSFAQALWAKHDGKASFVGNRLVLVSRFPVDVRRLAIKTAPTELVDAWMRVGIPIRVIQVGHARYFALTGDGSAAASAERERILRACVHRLGAASAFELRNVPFLMHRIGMTQRSHFGRTLIRALLAKASFTTLATRSDQHGAIRMLFDIAQTAPDLEPLVTSELRVVLEEGVGPESDWDFAEACGLLLLLSSDLFEPAFTPPMLFDDEGLAEWLRTATAQEAALAIVGATQVFALPAEKLPTPLVARATRPFREARVTLDLTTVLSGMLSEILSSVETEPITDDGSPLDLAADELAALAELKTDSEEYEPMM